MAVTGRAGYRDLLLPLAVVAVVGMMIFPLPPVLLDILLTANISFSLCLLLSAMYLAEPARFTSLPTILLLTTLFRLGLNIATTRQILAHGTAPHIVLAFGEFVVGGNLVVGVVVFLIVTLVQFLVIAKGAERIAEVAARFALDAMPGKQMSIDADIRAGVLSLSEAKEKRKDLQRESKLYGALDGAMKFVKGDAIAGLLITALNITAGLVIGVIYHGLSISESAARYTLFTIGDGLVAQIPALLVAVAAGLAVTRVEDKEESMLGRDMLAQLTREPQALSTTSSILFVLALVPGLPTVPFLCASVAFAVMGSVRRRTISRDDKSKQQGEFRPRVFSILVLQVSPEAIVQLQRERELPQFIQQARQRIFENWGVIVPDVQFDVNHKLPGVQVGFRLHGIVLDSVRQPGEWLASSDTLSSEVGRRFELFLREHLLDLMDDTQTRMVLEVHQSAVEDLINSLIPTYLSTTSLTAVLRELVRDELSIREVKSVLQAIAEFYIEGARVAAASPAFGTSGGETGASFTRIELVAYVRQALARQITRAVADDAWNVSAVVLDAEIDALLTRSLLTTVPIDPSIAQALGDEVKRILSEQDTATALVTSAYARAACAETLAEAVPGLRVIASGELSREARVTVGGVISVSRDADISDERVVSIAERRRAA